jgi:hypothetical protein
MLGQSSCDNFIVCFHSLLWFCNTCARRTNTNDILYVRTLVSWYGADGTSNSQPARDQCFRNLIAEGDVGETTYTYAKLGLWYCGDRHLPSS